MGHLCQLGRHEQSVPQLLPDAVGRVQRLAGLHGLPQLPHLFLQLVQGAHGALPVKTGLGSLGGGLFRPPQGRQGVGHGLDGVGGGALAFFLPLQNLPVHQNLLAVVGLHGAAKYMGVSVHQLLGHAVHHVVHGEVAPLGLNLGVEHHLHQNIPQFLAHGVGVVAVQGVQDLIGLLQKIPADGRVGLLRVPGTAAGGAEELHDFQEVLPAIAALTLKIYHTLPAFARIFAEKP